MISFTLAQQLSDAGLRWQPRSGDTFTLLGDAFDGESFAVSELTIEVHTYPGGQVLGFNGTTEWALDSVAVEDTLWLPREDQLRDLLGGTFIALTRDDASYQVHVVDAVTGEDDAHAAASPVDAYALALLALLRQVDVDG
ncbi:pilus assembly protein CpaE [Serinibacter arcticus]|uniref:Pilus assembly protein CpaE n=1 Tax=Serinibacter arcticus TaxID=1655435 RepID=A0A2U1ZZ02_9MICO|nr:pilus assembly protein CpaE [Serinibacter arcticus]PWD52216.1 pilus assembly protein CpaE [Serinibacter arcticus]